MAHSVLNEFATKKCKRFYFTMQNSVSALHTVKLKRRSSYIEVCDKKLLVCFWDSQCRYIDIGNRLQIPDFFSF